MCSEPSNSSKGLSKTTARFVFVNEVLVESSSDAPAGVVCVSFEEALKSHGEVLQQHFMQREMELGSAKFAALHLASVRSGVVVIVPKGVKLEAPIEVFHWAAGAEVRDLPTHADCHR